MSNETYKKLQAELSQLLNTEKYKRMTSKDKDVYRQAVLACKSVVSHYDGNKWYRRTTNAELDRRDTEA